jgi:16S rRNA (guanine527-N7)-methyltransferase
VETARAFARLERLVGWGLPLLRTGGELLALKGERAAAELEEAAAVLKGFGVRTAEVLQVGQGKVDPPTTLVRVVAERNEPRRRKKGRR